MKNSFVVFMSVVFSYTTTSAQQTFIKTMNATNYGSKLNIIATADLGWVIYSRDSTNLTKFNSCGESQWSKHYPVISPYSPLTGIISTKDGGFALLTRTLVGSVNRSCITKLDANGNCMWSNLYGDASYDQYPYSLMQDNQGNLLFYGNMVHISNSPLYSVLTKLDANGNLMWTKLYDFGYIWGGAISTSDNGCLFRHGNIFIKTDGNGNVQWTSLCLASSYYYLAPIEVSDGYIYTGYLNNGTQQICFYKITKQGALMWGGRKISDFIGNPPALRKKSNGTIVGYFDRTVVEFDKDLNIVNQKSIDNSTLVIKDICFPDQSTAVIVGTNNSQPFFAKTDALFNTDCKIDLSPTNLNLEIATDTSFVITTSNFNFTQTTQNSIANTFSISLTRLCSNKQLDLGNDTVFCKNETVILKNKTADSFQHYLWSTAETTASITANEPGNYWLKVWDDCGENILNDSISITVKEVITAQLGDDKLLCENGSAVLFAPDCDTCTFTWNTGSHADSLYTTTDGLYWLNVKSSNGCESTDTLKINYAKCECELFVPNSFTPNDDGLNDSFHPYYYCDFEDYSMQIFNRWGQLIFSTDNSNDEWNGKLNNTSAPTGIYIYRLSYTPIIKGEVQEMVKKSGTVAVIY